MLRESLELLKDMPFAARRANVVHQMEQRLETLIGPGLCKVIKRYFSNCRKTCGISSNTGTNHGDTDYDICDSKSTEQELHSYFTVFENLGRINNLCKNVAETYADLFLEDWERTMAAFQNEVFLDRVSHCLDQFTKFFEPEAGRCTPIFGSHAFISKAALS